MPIIGILLGHRPDGRPCVRNAYDNESTLPSFDHVRLLDPAKPIGPNWNRLPESAKIVVPYAHEANEFGRLLAQRTPPGPRYVELITEIWSRGYEVFLVGGTVRDVIAGVPTNDVDLVTTVPLSRVLPVLESMYRYPPSLDARNGFVRLGGTPGSGDPFIDLKMFSEYMPGTEDAIFGASFVRDLGHRDFACNAIYYDPINQVLIDPSGVGVADAETRHLTLVCDRALRSAFHQAQIVIRFFKFLALGFESSDGTSGEIKDHFLPALPAMKRSIRLGYIKTQVLSKKPRHEHAAALDAFRGMMIAFGAADLWDEYIEPLKSAILGEGEPGGGR